MPSPRIPPISCLLSFGAVVRPRSGTKAAEKLSVTPDAASHRISPSLASLERVGPTLAMAGAERSIAGQPPGDEPARPRKWLSRRRLRVDESAI